MVNYAINLSLKDFSMLKKILILILFTATLLNATTPTKQNVTKLYVATLDRAPDNKGLNYWVDDSNLNLEQIAMSFFDQPELDVKYPKGTTYREFIKSIYSNLFKRVPDTKGWDYWEAELESGSVPRSLFILAIINGALGDDAKILANRATVGLSYANAKKDDIPLAINILKGVTANYDSVSSALCTYKIVECVNEKPKVEVVVVEDDSSSSSTESGASGSSTSTGGSTSSGGSTSGGTSSGGTIVGTTKSSFSLNTTGLDKTFDNEYKVVINDNSQVINMPSNSNEVSIDTKDDKPVIIAVVNSINEPILVGKKYQGDSKAEVSLESTAELFTLRTTYFFGVTVTDDKALSSRIRGHSDFPKLVKELKENIESGSTCPLDHGCSYGASLIANKIASEIDFKDLVVGR